MTTNFTDQFNRLNDQSHVQLYRAEVATEQRAEFTESVDSLRTEFSKLTESVALVRTEFGKLFDDHKSAALKLVDDYKTSPTLRIPSMFPN